jgi:hypothetical protein
MTQDMEKLSLDYVVLITLYVKTVYFVAEQQPEQLSQLKELKDLHLKIFLTFTRLSDSAMITELTYLDYLQILCDEEEKVVAFGFMIPSPVDALKRSKGHLFPFGFIDFFKELKRGKVLDMLLVAVDPEYRSSGALSLLLIDGLKNAIKNKVQYAETGPELETNQDVNLIWKHFTARHHKSRSAFVKKIGT